MACDEGGLEPDDFDFRTGGGGRSAPPPGEDDGNGRGGGDWLNNGLQDWNVSGIDVDFPLESWMGLDDDEVDDDSDDEVDDEGWLADGDEDESEIIHYIVECALAQGDSISKVVDGQTVVLDGMLGLAPEWKTGACDEDCQQWVSACLMARRNHRGQSVTLWVQGDHPALGFGDDPDRPLFEAAYFGNLFTPSTTDDYACKGTTSGLWTALWQGRTCALGDGWCDLSVFDTCADAGCQPSPTGLDVLACQPDPAGPVYDAVSVHLAPLGG